MNEKWITIVTAESLHVSTDQLEGSSSEFESLFPHMLVQRGCVLLHREDQQPAELWVNLSGAESDRSCAFLWVCTLGFLSWWIILRITFCQPLPALISILSHQAILSCKSNSFDKCGPVLCVFWLTLPIETSQRGVAIKEKMAKCEMCCSRKIQTETTWVTDAENVNTHPEGCIHYIELSCLFEQLFDWRLLHSERSVSRLLRCVSVVWYSSYWPFLIHELNVCHYSVSLRVLITPNLKGLVEKSTGFQVLHSSFSDTSTEWLPV